MILYGHDKHGGFVVGDPSSGFTTYAYPTSANAARALTIPHTLAIAMMDLETVHRNMVGPIFNARLADYDRRNWDRLTMVLL